MSSKLFSTTCSIEGKINELEIVIDDDQNQYSTWNINDFLSKINDEQLNSIRFNIEPLFNNKKMDTKSKVICFDKLLSIKTDEQSSFSSEHFQTSIEMKINYVEINENFLWEIQKLSLEIDSNVAQQLCQISKEYLSKLVHRPKNLLVFVNPECGQNNGSNLYEEKVLSLFDEANINIKTIYTERANHAYDYISDESLDEYDGLICVGGDGMFSELCHSLLLRTARENQIDINDRNVILKRPNIRIGIIPAGSTDAVVFGTTGHNDPITSALQIILGTSLLIDIATVHNERKFVRFLATMLAYGFFGNIIRQSDRWRIFGPLRYSLSGFVQFIRNKSYHTQLIINRIDDNNNNNQVDSKDKIKVEDRYRTINCLNMPCRCEKSKYGMSPTVDLGQGSFDLILVKRSWRIDFIRFLHHAANLSHRIEKLPNVERFRTNEVFIRPMENKMNQRGNWACDGELFEAEQITIRSHRQILNPFANGIRRDQIEKINEQPKSLTKLVYLFFPFFVCLFVLFYYLFK